LEPISATHPIPLAPTRVASFDALYRDYRDEVFRWALRFSAGRQAWAEDVTHDVFLKLRARLDSLDTHELGAWPYRVTANQALARLRHESSWVTRFARRLIPGASSPRPDEALELRDDASASPSRCTSSTASANVKSPAPST
jgi:DNA-directed RNA polymerase specialized sigma24 family protein